MDKEKMFFDEELEAMMGKAEPVREEVPTDAPEDVDNGRDGTMLVQAPRLHGDDEVECFGGWMFRDWDRSGFPVIRFVAEGMMPSEVKRAEEWYGILGRVSRSRFLHRTGAAPVRVGDCTVFDFEIQAQMHSLGELHRHGKMTARNPETILRLLNELIMDYRGALAAAGMRYSPLNCLTMDTVFVDRDNNVSVLPVFHSGRNYPVEIAREAMTPGQITDERSDLYAAAYVAVEAFSDSAGDRPIRKPDSPVLQACLQTIRDWRPTPEEVAAWLEGTRPEADEEESTFWPWIKIPGRGILAAWLKKLRIAEPAERQEELDDTAPVGAFGPAGKKAPDPEDTDDSWKPYGGGK